MTELEQLYSVLDKVTLMRKKLDEANTNIARIQESQNRLIKAYHRACEELGRISTVDTDCIGCEKVDMGEECTKCFEKKFLDEV